MAAHGQIQLTVVRRARHPRWRPTDCSTRLVRTATAVAVRTRSGPGVEEGACRQWDHLQQTNVLDDPPGKIKNGPQVVKNSFNNRGVQQRAPPPFPEKIQAWWPPSKPRSYSPPAPAVSTQIRIGYAR